MKIKLIKDCELVWTIIKSNQRAINIWKRSISLESPYIVTYKY